MNAGEDNLSENVFVLVEPANACLSVVPAE